MEGPGPAPTRTFHGRNAGKMLNGIIQHMEHLKLLTGVAAMQHSLRLYGACASGPQRLAATDHAPGAAATAHACPHLWLTASRGSCCRWLCSQPGDRPGYQTCQRCEVSGKRTSN